MSESNPRIDFVAKGSVGANADWDTKRIYESNSSNDFGVAPIGSSCSPVSKFLFQLFSYEMLHALFN